MAAELDQLRRQADQLAKQFKQKGYPELADTLSADSKSYGARAKIARKLGVPEHFSTPVAPQAASKETAPTIDLRQQTYELLSLVREPTPDEKEALKGRGIVFLPVDTKTYAQVVAEDPAHFWESELNYANGRPVLRDYALPVAVEIGLKPTELAMPGSFSKSQKVQLEMAEARSQELKQEFPDVRVIMLPVTGYAQWDHAYNEKFGEVAFKNYFARGLDMLSEVNAADAGRFVPSERFDVNEWDADYGSSHVALVPAVVFVKNQELAS